MIFKREWIWVLVWGMFSADSWALEMAGGPEKEVPVVVAAAVLEPDRKVAADDFVGARAEAARRRLRESAHDLSRVLAHVSGSRFPVVAGGPGDVGIFIGEEASARFGPVGLTAPDGQAIRVVVQEGRAGLYGESDLASSYAIYSLLEGLGCRWYVPGEIGECLPPPGSVKRIEPQDTKAAPFTIYRGVWFADDAFRRRNRLRDMEDRVEASHSLENYISKAQREAHLDWCALIDGRRDPARPQLAWGNPAVAGAIAESLIARLEKKFRPSVSLSPLDQHHFSEGEEDTALDAGVMDPTMQTVAVTDRLVHLANAIVGRVSEKFPQVKYGLLAYHQYVTPPKRERPDPRIVPVIAPITYNRFHSMLDDRIATSELLREIVEGWGKITETGFYGYAFNLAEPLAPFPMIRRYERDLPFLFRNNVKYWVTETMPTFEANLHALTLGIRLSWDPSQDPRAIVSDLNEKFYGPAAGPMGRYWDLIDRCWDDSTNLAGGAHGYLDRFPPETIEKATSLLDEAAAGAAGPPAAQRVALTRDSFDLFRQFLGLLADLSEGRIGGLDDRARAYAARLDELLAKHGPYCFAGQFGRRYYAAFWQPVFEEAGRLAAQAGNPIAGPVRDFLIAPTDAASEPPREAGGRPMVAGRHHWNQLGFMDYFGPMWHDATFRVEKLPRNGKALMWLSSFDDKAEVFLNGHALKPLQPDEAGGTIVTGFCKPAAFDAGGALRQGDNRLQIRITRSTINETGTGGLLGPVYVFENNVADLGGL